MRGRIWLASLGWMTGLLTTGAQAGLTIVQQVEGNGSTSEMTIRLEGTKARSDVAAPWSIITDTATGETIYLHHTHQTYSRVSAVEAGRLGAQVRQAQEGSGAGILLNTGEKKVFGKYPAELYTWSIGAMKMRLWITREFPNGLEVQAQLDRLQQTGLAAAVAGLMPTREKLPGLRWRTEVELKGQRVSYTIVSAQEEAQLPEQFSIPKEYREVPFSIPANLAE